jgi:hypothetical protein
MSKDFRVREVVNSNNLNICPLGKGGAEIVSANTTKTVDTNFDMPWVVRWRDFCVSSGNNGCPEKLRTPVVIYL